MDLLSDREIADRLSGSGWERQGGAIVRELSFADFASALAFVNVVGEAAETLNHHPDILLHSYNRVRLTLSTHSAGGVTQRDLELAGRIDALAPS
ncbi:MAG TPA: 4a-hydroxytetrahydrobiopterin dehydratase [Solirubrobacteraceae bacterium]|nr:4a-hydroxytetrahydrobiopterin dehydratase [Solirubrobacteraceae bacterium]